MIEMRLQKRDYSQRHLHVGLIVVCLQIGLMIFIPSGLAADTSSGLGPYFGEIPVFSESHISELRQFLKSIDDSDCQKIEKECPPLDVFFDKFMGDIRNPINPKLLVFIDDNFKVSVNMITCKNRVTPYLFDAQNIWVTVFSEKNIEIEAMLTTLYKAFTFGRLSRKIFMSSEVTKKERETRNTIKPLNFRKIGEENIENNLWLGIVRFYLEPQTSNRISIFPGKAHSLIKKKTVTVHETGKITIETEDKSEIKATTKKEQESGSVPGFYRAEANFTNSMGNRFGLSAAIGATFGVDDDRVKYTHLDKTNFDAYLCAHLYLIRPILTRAIEKRSYKPSLSLFAGTPVDILSEIVVGLSVGHLFGKNGLSLGLNIMDPFEKEYNERQIRAFLAFDIRFW
jgi:hypothetical protein